MKLTDEQKAEIQVLMERFWNDVAGLPWQDKVWTRNLELRQQSKQHFVNATAEDVIKTVEGEANATTESND